jgi:hypothetical protein
MANPWNRAAAGTPITWPLGPNRSPDNFSGLPNGQAKTLGVVSPGTLTAPLGDLILPPWKITLASSPTAGTGVVITRYLLFTEDNTTPIWPGGISPTATGDQSSTLATWLSYDPIAATANGAFLDQIIIQTGVTVYQTRWITLRGLVGNIASYNTVLIYNQSGVAFAAYSAGPPVNQAAGYVTDAYN